MVTYYVTISVGHAHQRVGIDAPPEEPQQIFIQTHIATSTPVYL